MVFNALKLSVLTDFREVAPLSQFKRLLAITCV